MIRDDVHSLIDAVVGVNAERKDIGDWVSFHCPFARWTHERGTDTRPSAGISVTESGESSIFNCFTCGSETRGSIKHTLEILQRYSGRDFTELFDSIDDSEEFSGVLPEWGRRRRGTLVERRELDSDYLELYDSAVGHWYPQSRGLTDETIESLGLLVDPADSRGVERILFPVYYEDGVLAGITGRAVVDGVDPRIRDYHGLKKEQALLGLQSIAGTADYVVVSEGLFDYAMLRQYGCPSVAAMHANLTPHQVSLLTALGVPVVLMFDNDLAGKRAAKTVAPLLARHLPVSVVKYNLVPRAASVKDPANLSRSSALELIRKAVLWTGKV